MLRINLMPPEVLEQRRWEKWYRYVFFAFAALLILILLVAAWVWLMAQAKQDALLGLQQSSQNYAAKAASFSVFEKRREELAGRQALVDQALDGRVNMGRLVDDISLILPEEIWVEQLRLNQDTGLDMDAYTPLSASKSANVGYKSVAKTLVRLDSLVDLDEVWLTAASATEYGAWQVAAGSETPTTTADVVRFQVNGKIQRTQSAQPDSANPAGDTVGQTD